MCDWSIINGQSAIIITQCGVVGVVVVFVGIVGDVERVGDGDRERVMEME